MPIYLYIGTYLGKVSFLVSSWDKITNIYSSQNISKYMKEFRFFHVFSRNNLACQYGLHIPTTVWVY